MSNMTDEYRLGKPKCEWEETDELDVLTQKLPMLIGNADDTSSEEDPLDDVHSDQESDTVADNHVQKEYGKQEFEEPSVFVSALCYLAYMVMILFARIRDFMRNHKLEKIRSHQEDPREKGFSRLYGSFESIYINSIYRHGRDIMYRPVISNPGAAITCSARNTNDYGWTFHYGQPKQLVNLGSYNYLGFAENHGAWVDADADAIDQHGVAQSSTFTEFGALPMHRQLDNLCAEFLGVEAAVTVPMGFGTNSMCIPSIIGQGGLILSDELNHASLVLGCRLSGAQCKVFAHNDMTDLERKIRNAIVYGNPVTKKPYTKILIIVEGIYSMEGSMSLLREIVALKKRYGCYLFLDEAHSIGAMGATGRGVTEYWGVSPTDVDVMMGTFSKSFAAAGGYVAGSKRVIDCVRAHNHAANYGAAFAAPVVAQITATMKVIMGKDGTDIGRRKIEQLHRNTRYFRRRLKQMGLIVYGSADSPIVPIMTFWVTKAVDMNRAAFRAGLAVVGAAYPAVPLTKARTRLCLSAGHTKQQLDFALEQISKLADRCSLRYGRRIDQEAVIQY